ncbi:2-amino-4-hydroxy-6-hydroxymethyldihydropteridine diphosphokinase [Dyella caseinilytica]|uniref:2-amino-4-hydroxy-6-hydroxymethyldihydropteridine pyrophosphokinase n=1 Tax=Dyella caseinilytica TaxID=1849581 RepID=A0ABX7GUF6_9GAMM|nr:2-amino-4-hydroxy-6-hydroxymethyldihydropteridine diphosphokinase [Dyella caseinilytica]QRN54083.1 2-amino-4-hydroxy-6-hydroxymethyldihydropteridine diphosphokinase [Dyella caseinilytica]GFZ91469.1 2-amino-4-hydroxy-6-hydroxymethyldihydropteridine diphosphokinase [Dyella caseinilytica]
MPRVYLSLGSNQESHRYLRVALDELRARFGKLDISPAYRSAAVGFDGPDFINLAVGMDTDLSPPALNDWLHALEDRHGRRRDVPRYADRTLDVDIVLYDDLVTQGPGHLDIPRKELKHAFVLKPMVDIAPELRHPVNGHSMAELWAAFPVESEPLSVEPL